MQSLVQPGFLVLEGMDGTGTTTISHLVADGLRARDLRVCLTAEPTDGPLGRLLRSHLKGDVSLDPHTTALVFSGDRADHLSRTIRPALARGEWVVCDRYLLSTLAYQGVEGVSREAILAASSGFEKPELTVVLDASDEVREQRMAGRDGRERYENQAFSSKVRSSYESSIELLRRAGHTVEVIDATAVPDIIAERILARLDTL